MGVLKIALRPWKKSPILFSLATLGTSGLVTILALAFLMDSHLKKKSHELSLEQVLTVYVNPVQADRVIPEIEDTIRQPVGAQAATKPIEMKSFTSEEFKRDLEKNYPDLYRQIQDLGPEGDAMVPRFISLSGEIPSSIADKVSQIHGVEQVDTSEERHKETLSAIAAFRKASAWGVAALALACVLLLLQVGRYQSEVLSPVVKLFSQWGASSFKQNLPILLSSALFSLIVFTLAFGFMNYGVRMSLVNFEKLTPLFQGFEAPGIGFYLGVAMSACLLTLGLGKISARNVI